MIVNSKRDGNTLVLTIRLEDAPYRSKTAIEKARKEWDKVKHPEGSVFDPDKVVPTMLASSGGFERVAGVKLSYNITVA